MNVNSPVFLDLNPTTSQSCSFCESLRMQALQHSAAVLFIRKRKEILASIYASSYARQYLEITI